ncbi:MAG: helix-turn-helix transcriptional regulator [Bacteroidota bacterium]
MESQPQRIPFHNQKVPDSQFDLVKIEHILSREMAHSPFQLHRLNFYGILVIIEGQGYHTIDFREYKYQTGTMLLLRKDQVHKFFRTGDTKGYLVAFTEDFVLDYFANSSTLSSLQLFNETLNSPMIQLSEQTFADILHLVNYMDEEYLRIQDHFSPEIILSLLHILLTKLYRHKSSQDNSVWEKKYLSEFIHFQQLVEVQCFSTKKVKDYADQLGFSAKKLNMVVQSVVEKSAKTFIDEITVLHIKRLLINSSLSIKEIAYEAGFEDPSNLFRYFKKYTEATPEAFRQAYL